MTLGKRILVVEDEVITAMDVQRRLIKLGYSVPELAHSGEEAIDKASKNNPDLILMDINLNGAIDGVEAASRILSFIDIPIIYLTAYTDEKILERVKITEPYAYLVKPFKERELLINIEVAFYKNKMEKMLKESYDRLRESKQWLGAAINSIGDAVVATDQKGQIQLINPMAQALTGWKEEEALGKDLAAIFNIVSEGTDEQAEDPVKKVIQKGSFYGLAEQTILVAKDGVRIPVDIIGSPIKDEDNIIGVVLVFYDIIERKKIESSMKIKKTDM
jgi:PAS domain S-box-containing protein